MVQTCYICKWRADKEPRRSFHKFPFDENEKQKWLDIIGKSNVSLGKRTSVCSIHFDKTCFRYGVVNGRELLRPGSIPTMQLTKPPEMDMFSGLYYNMPVDVEVKLDTGEVYAEWSTTTDVHGVGVNGTASESLDNSENKSDEIVAKIDIEVLPAAKKTKRARAVRVKREKEKFKKRDKKQSYLRELVERLRREHIKLKNYIQSLEEKQKGVDRNQKNIKIKRKT